MSFASERAVRCLGNQFQYCLLIECIKTPAVLKCQQFDNSKSDVTDSRASKCPRVDENDNQEGKVQMSIRIKVVDIFPLLLVCKKSQTA